MSGAFPNTTGFRTLDFQSNTNSRVSVSVSGKSQRIKTGQQFWSLKVQSPSKDRADFMADYSFIVQQDGQVESFTFVPPGIGSTRGTATGTITLNATYGIGSSLVKGNGGSGTLKKGDLIKFSNHNKIYMLTQDINMDSSSEDFINFYPPLTTAVTNSTTVTYENVPITVYQDSDNIKFVTQSDGTFRYELVLNEEI
jgi:hypothetical protein